MAKENEIGALWKPNTDSDRAQVRQECAEKAVEWFMGQGEDPDELAERLRAVIVGQKDVG